jgi:hypothetical protein
MLIELSCQAGGEVSYEIDRVPSHKGLAVEQGPHVTLTLAGEKSGVRWFLGLPTLGSWEFQGECAHE